MTGSTDEAEAAAVPVVTGGVDALFEPLRIRGTQLRNRIVMPPMGRFQASGHVPSPDYVGYFRRRAEGGAGLLIGEGGAVAADTLLDGTDPAYFGEPALAAWRAVIDAVHGAGARFVPQLWHGGMARSAADSTRPDLESPSPSGIFIPDTDAGLRTFPAERRGTAMTQGAIDDVVSAFARTARAMADIGCDGIELHGGHGYLIDQFLWRRTNERTDGYGGRPRERARFAAEVVAEVRRAIGPDLPILFRFSQWKVQDYGAAIARSPQELEQLLAPVVDAGADVLDCSTRRLWAPAFDGDERTLAAWTRSLFGVPVIAVGSVGMASPFGVDSAGSSAAGVETAIEMLERGDFDLLAIGRGHIADPGWADLVRTGRGHERRPYSRTMLDALL